MLLIFLHLIFDFRKTGREGEREGEKHGEKEKHQLVAFPVHPTGNQTYIPDMCPN